jgi:hypothetical protein
MRNRAMVLFVLVSIPSAGAFAESPLFRDAHEDVVFFWSNPDYTQSVNVQVIEGNQFYGSEPTFRAIVAYSNSVTGEFSYCEQFISPSDGDHLVMDRSATRVRAEIDLTASQCYPSPPAFPSAVFECENTVDSHQFSFTSKGVTRVESDEIAPGQGHGVYLLTQRYSADSSGRISFEGGPTLSSPARGVLRAYG